MNKPPLFIDSDLVFLVNAMKTLDPNLKELASHSGVSISTIRKWRKLTVRRPQHCTLKAVALALGWKMTFTPLKKKKD